MILALVNDIQNAFKIPEQLQGFSCLDPQKLPNLAYDLKEYGVEQLNKLALFYGNQRQVGNKSFNPVIDKMLVPHEFETFKTTAFLKRANYKTKMEPDLISQRALINSIRNNLSSTGDLLSNRKKLKMQKRLSEAEHMLVNMEKNKIFSFSVLLQSWLSSGLEVRHPNISKLMRLAAIIPGSTAKVERSFSLMNRLSTDSRSH